MLKKEFDGLIGHESSVEEYNGVIAAYEMVDTDKQEFCEWYVHAPWLALSKVATVARMLMNGTAEILLNLTNSMRLMETGAAEAANQLDVIARSLASEQRYILHKLENQQVITKDDQDIILKLLTEDDGV